MTPPELVEMSRYLGQPHLNYVIIGEGNTSQRVNTDSFWIKASGQQMTTIGPEGFVQIRLEPILALLNNPPHTSHTINMAMESAKVDPHSLLRPSVEVSFHAMLLRDCNVPIIAHTHPVAINQILCSTRAAQFATHRTFPDEVVLCGPESVYVAKRPK
jgi:rhamnose utilization protein RhaD (predicted bifunctional aldolase and dehydrogenase)